MREILKIHKKIWGDPRFTKSTVAGFFLLIASLVINYFAGTYADRAASQSVNDLLLDLLPTVDVAFLFVQGFAIAVMLGLGSLIVHPKAIPFTFKSYALFILVRAFFIVLTHLGPSPERAPIVLDGIGAYLSFNADFFFSAHTGAPYLMALIFWRNFNLRILFCAVSMLLAITVLLGHLHYSIDVFAAYFITYSIYKLSQRLFREDYDRIPHSMWAKLMERFAE